MIEAEVDGIEVLIRYRRLLAILFYPTLVLFEQANCIDWINFCYILSLTDLYSLLWYPCHTLPVELWEPNCKSSSSSSWVYGSWSYNYLCNQCLSLLTLWVRIPLMVRCIRYNIMWSSLLVVFFAYSGFLHQ